MQNIDVRFNATSNFSRVRSEIKALKAEAASLNQIFNKSAYAAAGTVDSTSWQNATAAVSAASRTYRDAASSSGLFTTQQIKAVSETERYTRALQKQKLALVDMIKHRGIMREVYRDQLRYQRMTAQYWGTDSQGRAITDIAIPKNVPKDLDTLRRRIGFVGNILDSTSTQLVNWGKNTQWAGRQLTVGLTYPITLFGAAAGIAAYKVESGFAKIAKVYDVTAEAQNNAKLREKELADLRVRSMDLASEAARKYGASLQSTLDVEQELAASGIRGQQLLDTTKEVQRISGIGEIDPSETTKMIISLNNAFKLTGQEMTDTLNFMNAAANATSLDLQDIVEATPRAATAISQLGGSVRDMVVLLVSMREAGVDAAEGANALKSATTRIINPVKKAKEYYAQFNIDLEKLASQSGGNLFEYLKLLGAEQQKIQGPTEKQTALMRAQGVAALFGTYQNNRLTASLVNISDAYAGVNNQTKAAMDIAAQSDEQNAKIAANALDAMMNNPAGRLRAQWQALQIELAELGQPFLQMAGSLVKILGDLISEFNEMGPGVKHFLTISAIITGLIGPGIMLVGLMGNLAGNVLKGIALVAKWVGISTLVNKEEQAALLTTEQQNAALLEQKHHIATVAQEVNVLAQAFRAASEEAARYFNTSTAASNSPILNTGPGYGPNLPKLKSGANAGYTLTPSEARFFRESDRRTPSGLFIPRGDDKALEAARERLTVSQKQEKIESGINSKLGQGVALMGAFSLATTASVVSSNQMVDKISQVVMFTTLAAPAVGIINKGIMSAGKNTITWAKSMSAMSASAGGLKTTVPAIGKGLLGLGGSLLRFAGPTGLIAAGAIGILAWRDHIKKVKAEQDRLNASLVTMNKSLNENIGLQEEQYEDIKTFFPGETKENPGQIAKLYKEYSSSKNKGIMKDFANEEVSNAQRASIAKSRLIELQERYGLSADEASKHVQAMYLAAGEGATEAFNKTQELLNQLDKMGEIDFGDYLGDSFKSFSAAIAGGESDSDSAKAAAKNYVDSFNFELRKNANNPEKTKEIIDSLIGNVNSLNSRFETTLENAIGSEGVKEVFRRAGVKNIDEYMSVINKSGKAAGWKEMFLPPGAISNTETTAKLAEINNQIVTAQSLIVGGIAKGKSGIGMLLSDDIKSIDKLKEDYNILMRTMTEKDAAGFAEGKLKEVEQLINMRPSPGDHTKWGPDNQAYIQELAKREEALKTLAMNTAAYWNIDLKGATTAREMWTILQSTLNGTADNIDKATGKVKQLNSEVNNLPAYKRIHVSITSDQVPGIIQSAMSSTQSAMADSAMAAFDSRWDRKIDAAKKAADARAEGAKKAGEAAVDRIQKQIDAEKKADDIRQKLFENEKKRLQQLADMANKNIDWNTAIIEGRLDDAAKIQNDMQAQTAIDLMDEDAEKSKGKSQKKIDRLEKQKEAVQKAAQAQSDAAKASADAQIASMERVRDYEKASLQQRLDAFKAFIPRDLKELKKHMASVGLSYKNFGGNIMAYGASWGESIQKTLTDNIRIAGLKVRSDNIWGGVTKEMVGDLINELGFSGIDGFRQFVRTGKLPKTQTPKGSPAKYSGKDPSTLPPAFHGGGIVGTGKNDRTGFSGGMSSSEQLVLAQKGERVVDKKKSRKYEKVLDAIERGIFDADIMGGSGYAPVYGYVGGAVSSMMGAGYAAGIKSGIDKMSSRKSKKGGAPGVPSPSGSVGGYVPGPGGRHRPINASTSGRIHDSPPAVDFAAPVGTPIYAVADGTISRSYDIRGYEPRRNSYGRGQDGFRSYGRVMYLRTNSGPEVLYAHLSQRGLSAGAKVKGGAVIGRSGDTGNSTGPHLHFGSSGASPMAWLRKGGEIRWDNTPAMLHRGETVLTAPLTKKLKDNVASDGNVYYDVNIDLRGAYIKEDVDVQKAMDEWWNKKEAKLGRKRVVN